MIDLPTLAISLYAPWVIAILRFGKDVENRGLNFPRRHRGPIWLHASKGGDIADEAEAVAEMYEAAGRGGGLDGAEQLAELMRDSEELRGHIVGRVDIVGVTETSRSAWAVPGKLHLQLARPVEIATPVPCRGALGLWRVPADVLDKLKEVSGA